MGCVNQKQKEERYQPDTHPTQTKQLNNIAPPNPKVKQNHNHINHTNHTNYTSKSNPQTNNQKQSPKTTKNQKEELKIYIFIENKVNTFFFNNSKTYKELKQYVHQQYYPELLPAQFVLHPSQKLQHSQNKVLGELTKFNQLRFIFKQAKLEEVEGLKVSTVQGWSGLNTVARMSCSHSVSRQEMQRIVQNSLRQGKNQILCPLSCQWNLQEIRLVGGYSKSEMQFIIAQTTSNQNSHTFFNNNTKISTLFHVPEESSSSISVTINLINGISLFFQFDKDITANELKSKIIQENQELQPCQMVLMLNNQIATQSKIKLATSHSNHITFTQRKAEVWEIKELTADKEKQDEVACTPGVAKMSCGHWYGRDSMISLINTQLSEGEKSIKCPYQEIDGNICNTEWRLKDCRFVAGFTQTEMNNIEEKLSKNAIFGFSKQCPSCQNAVCFQNLNSLRVKCPICKNDDFCYSCLSPWRTSNKFCQSDICTTKRIRVAEAPWTRTFRLTDRKTKEKFNITTPDARACPRCGNIIYNTQQCKHTKCPCMGMKYSFCFVCLGLYQNSSWPCGEFYEYCGSVAPNQTFS